MVTKSKVLFFSLVTMIIIVTITIINLGMYGKQSSEKPEQIVEQVCNFIRYGDKKSLEKLITNAPSDFSYRLYIAYGGRPLEEDDIKNSPGTSPNSQNLSGDELLKTVISTNFSLNEKIIIKEFLESSQFQDEAKVKVLLAESDLKRERIYTFLLTEHKDGWKVFLVDNGALPENFVFGQPHGK